MSTPAILTGVLLAIASLLGSWRASRREARAHRMFFIAVQPMLAGLLWLALWPPSMTVPDNRLTVVTASGRNPSGLGPWPWEGRFVRLPDAPVNEQIETVPDLATALRRHPSTDMIVVRGAGLSARDRAAIGDRGVAFDAPKQQGLLSLQTPMTVPQGTQWFAKGQALWPVARLELRDPGDGKVDEITLSGNGEFQLSGPAHAAGRVRYELRAFDAGQHVVDHVSIPIIITGSEPLHVILRAGAPDPEFKYWRRWAADAGIDVRASADVSEGLHVRDGDVAFTQAALASTDLVIIDERAWPSLDTGEKAALGKAVSEGLGLLLRVTGPVEPAVSEDWKALGFVASSIDEPAKVTLDQALGLHERSPFTSAPVELNAEHSSVGLAADDRSPIFEWHEQGRGRVGYWRLLDSYRLILSGEPGRYAQLWQAMLAQMSRAKAPDSSPSPRETGQVDERTTLCHLAASAQVREPDDVIVRLLQDRSACAAFWPRQAGWHQLESGAESAWFYVRARDEARGITAAKDRAETLEFQSRKSSDADGASHSSTRSAQWPRWPFLLAWLALAVFAWWRERPA